MERGNHNTHQHSYRTLFWLVLTLMTLFRLFFVGKLGLGVDESHYLLYSRRLAWGYFDHPPMVAFLVALTTLWGDSVFFVRLGPVICSSLSLILMRYLALAFYRDERVPFWAAVLLHLMPYQHMLMVGLLPDATLNIFWCGTLLTVWHAMKSGKWSMWILTGLLFGGALLSKYHALLLVLCMLGYLITSANHRIWLKKIEPYLAVLIGLIVFLPNILWNVRHEWVSYAYQLGQRSGDGLDLGKFMTAVGGQLAAWSPLIFGLLIAAVIAIIRQEKISDADRFAVWTSIPIFIFFCLTGLTSKILPHWTSVGWWSGSIVVTVFILRKISPQNLSARRMRRWSIAAAITGLVMTILLHLALFWPITYHAYTWARKISFSLNQKFPFVKPLEPWETGFDIGNDLYGWQKIADRVEAIRAQMPQPANTFVFGHRFHSASQMAVYLKPTTEATTLNHKYNQFRLWFEPAEHIGWDALFIVEKKRHDERAKRYLTLFARMDPDPMQIRILRDGQLAHELMVYRYYGFKGRYEK